MMLLMLATVVFPLLACVPAAGSVRWPGSLLVLAPAPALVLALFFGQGELALPSLLLGGAWVLDDIRRTFLLLTALLWLFAGIYAVGYMRGASTRGFRVFWLLTLTGNLGLILAADIAGFYTFFALMTFSAYGLIVHAGTDEARRAGRIYLIMAVLGEMLLLAGFLLAAREAGSLMLADLPAALAGAEHSVLLIGLLGSGFGVKAGLPLLHFWLPLAHPVAPTPASAVLSGAMIKAGLLGWLLVLPLGVMSAPVWSNGVILLGAVGALGAGVVGVCQRNPKTVLAYSSISQMGLMTLLVGVALSERVLAAALVPVLALYALHHGLAKGALFLAVGLHWPESPVRRALLWLPVVLPGLALAGLPWTSGAAAKLAAKEALGQAPEAGLVSLVPELMSAGAVATTLLVVRFVFCLADHRDNGTNATAVVAGWAATAAASVLLFWWLPWPEGIGPEPAKLLLPDDSKFRSLSWPLLAGLGLVFVAVLVRIRAPRIPPGDGVVLAEYLIRWLGRRVRPVAIPLNRPSGPDLHQASERGEERIRVHSGVVLLALLVTALALFVQ